MTYRATNTTAENTHARTFISRVKDSLPDFAAVEAFIVTLENEIRDLEQYRDLLQARLHTYETEYTELKRKTV